ncbi:hypothetical protein EB061_07055 [bacterium]|jgi:hypothetical protein|nr:hypothetical protein [bacterium]
MKMHIRHVLLIGAAVSSLAGFPSHSQQRGQSVVERGRIGEAETLKEQRWGLSAQLGNLTYTDNSGSATSRMTLGVGFDWNASKTLRPDAPSNEYVGVSSGFLYSHPGATDANYLGASSTVGGDSNLFLIPIDLKLGYDFTDSFRLSVRGGGNLIYRSNASVSNMGAGSSGVSDLWKIYPNVGMDADIQLSSNFALTIRPDITLTPGNDLYVATLGATYVGF